MALHPMTAPVVESEIRFQPQLPNHQLDESMPNSWEKFAHFLGKPVR